MGTRFIATKEANAIPDYKEMIVDSASGDIAYSSLFTGVHGSYLKGSIRNAGLDPDNLPEGNKAAMDFGKADKTDAKAWRDIWGAGQGVGNIDDILPARELILRMEQEYESMQQELRKPE
jgi:nitronate monooxygenase